MSNASKSQRHEGAIRGFYRGAQAHCAFACGYLTGRPEDVMIGLYHPDGGTSGEFQIAWERIGDKLGAKLHAWDDSWSALTHFPDVLAKMAERDCVHAAGTSITPDELCHLLESCGLIDRTPRTDPREPKS